MATINGNDFSNLLDGTDKNDSIYGYGGNDTILGNSGNDVLYGGNGNDIFYTTDATGESIIGTQGADTMYGGRGSDTYFVDNPNDVVIENSGEGTDAVYYNIVNGTYTLPDNVERLFFVTFGNRNGNGNELSNLINGNCGKNILNGFEGNDTIYAGRGDDLVDGGIGDDKIYGGIGMDTIYGGFGNDYLMGESQDDQLLGGDGNDNYSGFGKSYTASYTAGEIYWGFGHDVINDSSGYDTLSLYQYPISLATFNAIDTDHDGKLDQLKITIGEYGTIKIQNYFDDSSSSISGSNSGTGYIEKIGFADKNIGFSYIQNNSTIISNSSFDTSKYILGTKNSDKIYGNDGNDTIKSGSSNDLIYGRGGHDIINGESGSDTMYGGKGNDIYYVQSSGDKVYENANEGNDLVISTVSYALGSNLENLTLADINNINGTGNDLDNTITGNSGNNTLAGKGGDDTYRIGYDSYWSKSGVAFGSDVINDLSGQDYLDCKGFNSSQISASALDVNNDGDIDTLYLDFGDSGSIKILNYFDNSASDIANSHAGSGYIEDIGFSNTTLHLY